MSHMSVGVGQFRPTEYLFIDGACLRKRYTEILSDFFGTSVGDDTIDFQQIAGRAHAEKTFYYDCLDDEKRVGESDSELDLRVGRQKAYFDRIQALPGFHVR